MNLTFLESIVVKYLKDHPEIVEKLIERVLTKILNQLDGDPTTN